MSESFRIDNVGIAVKDLEASLSFYRDLGFEVDEAYADSAVVSRESARLYLFRSNGSENAATRPLDMNSTDPGIDHISFCVGNLTEIIQCLSKTGIPIESGPVKQPWGATTVTVLDPTGVRLWFLDRAS